MKIAPMIEFLQPLSAQAEPLERIPALEQRFFLADHNLIYTDKMSMAAQLRAACGVGCVHCVIAFIACGVHCVHRRLGRLRVEPLPPQSIPYKGEKVSD